MINETGPFFPFLMFKPARNFILFILFLLVPCNIFGAELTITVKYPDGSPVRGVKVQELGLERANIFNDLLGTTDGNGQITAHMKLRPREIDGGDGGAYEYEYRYVVMPEDYRWEISNSYWNEYPPDTSSPSVENIGCQGSNSCIGKQIKVTGNEKLKWDVVLRRGSDTRVYFRDQFGKPIKNMDFSVSLDMEADTHTGAGGEIDMHGARTDNNGSIILHHTGDFYYSFLIKNKYPERSMYWVVDPGLGPGYPSSLTRKRFKGGKGTIVYNRCIGQKITVIVKDKLTGAPLQGAVIVGKFRDPTDGDVTLPLWWGSVTDSKGVFRSGRFCPDFATAFGASKEGYNSSLIGIDQYVPGRTYEFTLEPQ